MLTAQQITNNEDVNAKMRACGWDVIDIPDGNWNVEAIVSALETARRSTTKPTFINIHTVIGVDSAVEGNAVAHGAAIGKDNITALKTKYGFDPEAHFVVGPETRDFFAGLPERGDAWVKEWEALVDAYEAAYPDLGARFRKRMVGELDPRWRELIPETFPEKPTSTRAANGLVLNPIAKEIDSFMVGTADLSPSVYMSWEGMTDFQNVSREEMSTGTDVLFPHVVAVAYIVASHCCC
jgi:dihydroxyacetone synthase